MSLFSCLLPGVWRADFGDPEDISPSRVFATETDPKRFDVLPSVRECPLDPATISSRTTPARVRVAPASEAR